jgi:hypothetical protein
MQMRVSRTIRVLGALCAAAVFAGAGGVAWAESVDYVFVPPTEKAAGGLDAARYPLPRTEALRLLAEPMPERVFSFFDGQAGALKATVSEGPALEVAKGQQIDLDAVALFGEAAREAGKYRWLARVTSQGALALRLRADLAGFAPEQSLYLIGAGGGRTFGPFTRAQARDWGTWLPTTPGGTVTLVLESPDATLPPLRIEALSHFYRLFESIAAKDARPCPEPADCEGIEAARQVSTSVAMLIVPEGLGHVQCSGTLLNRSGTPTYDPLLISAHHCFAGAGLHVEDVEALWDYRTGSCDPAAETPDLDTLPRSKGAEMLAQSRRLDGQFLRLDGAPVGVYGRAWSGWDTRTPVVGDQVQDFHLPAGTPMKTSRGTVIESEMTECLDVLCVTRYEMQTTVRWDEGITQGGSSGSAMFYRNLNWRLGGMLSNGTTHTCGKPAGNRDDFVSFREFYPLIACHLVDGAECAPQEKSGCLFSKSLGTESSATKALRDFRDNWLGATSWGCALSRAYYKVSPPLARTIGTKQD